MVRRANANDRARVAARPRCSIFLREEKNVTLCILDNRYLVFIELVARVRISCDVRTHTRFFFHHFFSPSTTSFYGLLAFVYLKLRDVVCPACNNVERIFVPSTYIFNDRMKKTFVV